MTSQAPTGGVLDGRYLLHERIGGGRSGAVYSATHIALRKRVAVKLLTAGGRSSGGDFTQFRTEAEALGRLTHPGIVSVIDFGVDPEAGGTPYLVMELVDGVTLTARLADTGVPDLEAAWPWLRQMAAALDYAHAQGVCHGDFSPANVLLAGTGDDVVVKVIDFGLARLLHEAGEEAEGPGRASTVLDTRHALTPSCAAPERVRGAPVSASADVYAFAAVAYQTLTGCAPFDGDAGTVLQAHVTQPPAPPSARRPGLPPGVDAAVLHGLAKQPERRPASAGVLAQALSEPVRELARARWRQREAPRRWGLAAALSCGMTVLGALVDQTAPLRRAEAVTFDARVAVSPTRPPDRRLLVVSIDDEALGGEARGLADSGERVAAVLEQVMAAGPAVVVLDLLLPQTWAAGPRFGTLLLEHADRLVLGVASEGGRVVGPEVVDPLVAATLGVEATSRLFGLVSHRPDADGIVRRGRVAVIDAGGELRPTLAGRAWSLATATPLDGPDTFVVDYSVDTSRVQRFGWRAFERLLATGPWLPQRVVLIGAEFTGSGDRHRIPRSGGWAHEVSGLTLQAAHLDTLLQGRRLRDLSGWPVWMATAAGTLAVTLAAVWAPAWLALLVLAGVWLGVAAAGWLAFAGGVVVPLATPLLVVLVGAGLARVGAARWPAAPK